MVDHPPDDQRMGQYRYPHGSLGFTRTVNLSDAIFAIAMTLLVLTLDTPAAADGQLAETLIEQGPQLVAFVLSFAFVANIWWQHQKIVDALETFEPGLVALDLALLGAVALVPFPTSLVGRYPTERVAVLSLVGLFIVLSLLYLLMVVRAQLVGAWREPMPGTVWYWHLLTWGMGMLVLVVAGGLTFVDPLIGLLVLAVSIALGPITARWAYPASN